MSESPSKDFGPDDLAVQLLRHMGIGWTIPNAVAASDALRIKGTQPGFDTPKAWAFILKQWKDYKESPSYRSQYRRKAATWLTEGDYDNPESWGGKPLPKAFAAKAGANGGDSVADWKRDKELHPEKYLSPEEMGGFWNKLQEVLGNKRMPGDESSAQLRQKDASNSSTVGSREKPSPNENNGPQQ